jgi:glycerophosphoryl diester phosphodiesterase
VAAARGFLAVEVDVQLASDGIPVILHDETLERTTGCRQRADTVTSAMLATLRADHGFRSASGMDAGEASARNWTIPDLGALLGRCIAHGLRINLELKAPTADPVGLVAAVGRCLAETPAGWAPTHVLISSFDAGLVAQSHEQLPAIPRALLCETVEGSALDTAQQHACCALNIGDAGCTPGVIAAAGQLGMAVLVWTVNDLGRAHTLLADGVRSVITDRMEFASD